MNLPEKFKVRNICNDKLYDVMRTGAAYAVDPVGCLGSWGGYCKESVERFIERGLWEIVEEVVERAAAPSLLQKLKQLTTDTPTDIFISNGGYEVYFSIHSGPAKASSDEELEKIVDAILTLNKAVNGGDNA